MKRPCEALRLVTRHAATGSRSGRMRAREGQARSMYALVTAPQEDVKDT